MRESQYSNLFGIAIALTQWREIPIDKVMELLVQKKVKQKQR